MDVSVIVINYNTSELTLQCLKSIYEGTTGIEFEVIVVDNASIECNPDIFKEKFPVIQLVKSHINLGFAGGNNMGIKHASGKYILLLNSDTIIRDNAIAKTFHYAIEHPQAAAISAKLIYPDGRHQSAAQRFPSVKYHLIELLRLQKLMPLRVRGRVMLGAFFDHTETVRADWVWGTFFMFPRFILTLLPDCQLDNTYFMYFEDMQWCMDFHKLGYEVHFFAGAEIIHLMGGSAGKKNEMMEKNKELFLRRNYTKFQIMWIRVLEKLLS